MLTFRDELQIDCDEEVTKALTTMLEQGPAIRRELGDWMTEKFEG